MAMIIKTVYFLTNLHSIDHLLIRFYLVNLCCNNIAFENFKLNVTGVLISKYFGLFTKMMKKLVYLDYTFWGSDIKL